MEVVQNGSRSSRHFTLEPRFDPRVAAALYVIQRDTPSLAGVITTRLVSELVFSNQSSGWTSSSVQTLTVSLGASPSFSAFSASPGSALLTCD